MHINVRITKKKDCVMGSAIRKNLKLKENSPFSGISENNRWPRCAQKKILCEAAARSLLLRIKAWAHKSADNELQVRARTLSSLITLVLLLLTLL